MKTNWPLKLVVVLTVFSCGLLVGSCILPIGGASPEPQVWPVVNIVDGDTLDILYQPPFPIEERLRLIQVDTPERGDLGYQEAAEALETLVANGEVSIEFETLGEHERGAYGRLLVYLYSGGKCINVELVRLGWSANYTKYGEGRMNQAFEEAEQEAKESQRGLWGLPSTGE